MGAQFGVGDPRANTGVSVGAVSSVMVESYQCWEHKFLEKLRMTDYNGAWGELSMAWICWDDFDWDINVLNIVYLVVL